MNELIFTRKTSHLKTRFKEGADMNLEMAYSNHSKSGHIVAILDLLVHVNVRRIIPNTFLFPLRCLAFCSLC